MLWVVRVDDLALFGETIQAHFLGTDHGAGEEVHADVVEKIEGVGRRLVPLELIVSEVEFHFAAVDSARFIDVLDGDPHAFELVEGLGRVRTGGGMDRTPFDRPGSQALFQERRRGLGGDDAADEARTLQKLPTV